MPNFEVIITETLARAITVEAEDADKAFLEVCSGWKNAVYVLGSEDFTDVEFEIKVNGIVTRYDVKGNIRPH